VYKLDSFVGFIGDEQVHAQEYYACRDGGLMHMSLPMASASKVG
jgi:hypothetical protein